MPVHRQYAPYDTQTTPGSSTASAAELLRIPINIRPIATFANTFNNGDNSRQTSPGQNPVPIANDGGHAPFGAANASATMPTTTGTANTQFFPFEEVEGIYEYVNGESILKGALTSYYQSISCMPAYRGASFEELRVQDYQHGRKPPGSEFVGVQEAKPADGFEFMADHQMSQQLQKLDQRLQNIELQQQYLIQQIDHLTQTQNAGLMQQQRDNSPPGGSLPSVVSLESPGQQRSQQQTTAHPVQSPSTILPDDQFNRIFKQPHEPTTQMHSSYGPFPRFGESGGSNENVSPSTLGRLQYRNDDDSDSSADSDLQDILARSQQLVKQQRSMQRQNDSTHSESRVRGDTDILPVPSREVAIRASTSGTDDGKQVAESLQSWDQQLQDMVRRMNERTDDLKSSFGGAES